MFALPYDIRGSVMAQWGSGVPYSRKDETNGWGPARQDVAWYSVDAPDFRQVDLRLEKQVSLAAQGKVGVIFEVLNVFNHDNFRNYEELAFTEGGNANANFGKPVLDSYYPGRRLQLGLSFGTN